MRYLFTGDVGRGGHAILRDPQPVQDVDVLHIESTYGDRLHGDRDTSIVEIAKSIMETAHRGGKIIIPAFSVGRTQLVVYSLHQLHESGDLHGAVVIKRNKLPNGFGCVFNRI